MYRLILVGVALSAFLFCLGVGSFAQAQQGPPPDETVKQFYATLTHPADAAAFRYLPGGGLDEAQRLIVSEIAHLTCSPRRYGEATGCKSNLKNFGTACEMYSADFGGRYPTQLSVLTPNYLKTIPTCPAAHADTYSVAFVSSSGPDAYTVVCSGDHHKVVGERANYPQYTSQQGLLDAPDEGPKPGWVVQSYKILKSKVSGNPAFAYVDVSETSRLGYEEPVTVDLTFYLHRKDDGWVIRDIERNHPNVSARAIAALLVADAAGMRTRRDETETEAFSSGLAIMLAALNTWFRDPVFGITVQRLHQLRQADACVKVIRAIGQAAASYRKKNGKWPSSLAQLLPDLKRKPLCPAGGSYTVAEKGADLVINCSGNHHQGVGIPTNYPRWVLAPNPPYEDPTRGLPADE